MHTGDDVGGIDQIRVGTIHASDFDSSNEGWNAAGDGTMEWVAGGGIDGGHLQISDWATGDYHFAVAPLSWAGDWSSLMGQNITFYFKTDHPSYEALVEISSVPEKRLVLAVDDLSVPAGGATTMSVTLSEPSTAPLIVNLNSSASCFVVDSEISIAAGQTVATFDVTVPVDAEDGCTSVITASATGYGDSRITLRVEAASASLATVKGRVTDAITGVAIPNATISVAGRSTTTDSDGYYTLENIPTNMLSADFSGEPRSGSAPLTVHFTDLSSTVRQMLSASAEGYFDYESAVTLTPGEALTVNISLSPVITESELRIVLNWGDVPRDLDSHLLVPGSAGGDPFQVYYSSKGKTDDYPYAMLDIDDRSGFGPETITISQFVAGRYIFFVHNYSREQPITVSNAVVQIYSRTGLLHTVNVPLVGDGAYWHICDIDGATGQVTIKNTIGGDQPRLGARSLMKTIAKSEIASAADILSWQWDFNDDGIVDATEQNPSYTYTAAGNYSVSLTISDGVNTYTERKNNYITVTSDTLELTGYDVNVTGVDIANFPLVKCFVSVVDAVLRTPAETLGLANFDVTEENLDVLSLTVSPLDIASGAKADIVFVFDVTGSMGDEISMLKERSLAFADLLASRGIDYRLGLVTFSDEVEAINDFTADANEFKTWISGLVASGGGDTNENALEGIEAATRLSYRDNTQRIGILITDADHHEAGESGDGSTDQTTNSIIDLLNSSQITMHVVGKPDWDPHKKIAYDTGGRYYWITGDFSDIIDSISDLVTKQYVVTYVSPTPTPDDNWRDIEITVIKDEKGGIGTGRYYIGASRLIMNPPTLLGRVDDTFVLDIRAESVVNMGMAHFNITFDNTKIEALNVNEGDFLLQGGASSTFIQEIKNPNGRIEISTTRLVNGQEPGVTGSGLLAQISFKVKVQDCTSNIEFQTPDVRHPDNSPLYVTTSGASLRSMGIAGASDLLCDFDNDLDIDTRDFALLGTYWKPGNDADGDVGPAAGAVPLLTPDPDALVNYEDLFVFTRMWNWYHAALLSAPVLAKSTGDLTWQCSKTTDSSLRLAFELQNICDLSMGHFILHYDARHCAFRSAQEGHLLQPDASPVALLVEETAAGTLEVSFSRLTAVGAQAGVNGTGVLLTLDFERRDAAADLAVQVNDIDFRSPQNTQIYVKTAIDNTDHSTVQTPTHYALANYPNPFNSRTTIEFQVPEAGEIKIDVMNILGQPVKTIAQERFEAGSHKVVWDGVDDAGHDVVSGTFILRLQAGSRQIVHKILYLK
ncbi:VWA domain-containing protein [candidate division KSB1 bacterium]|nr:VWA domain-containing protein [candidate division KSB1 bacterium]RQW07429.1 MAG: VWA domain-containing protein [candidate division KSB1 bacterium]